MGLLAQFEDSGGSPVFVNAERVCYLRPSSAEQTLIVFEGDKMLVVHGRIGAVADALRTKELASGLSLAEF